MVKAIWSTTAQNLCHEVGHQEENLEEGRNLMSDAARTGTDLDLAPIMRTEANYWKAKFFQAAQEHKQQRTQ